MGWQEYNNTSTNFVGSVRKSEEELWTPEWEISKTKTNANKDYLKELLALWKKQVKITKLAKIKGTLWDTQGTTSDKTIQGTPRLTKRTSMVNSHCEHQSIQGVFCWYFS